MNKDNISKESCGIILFIYIVNLLSSKSELNKVTNTNNLQLSRVRREKKKSTLVSIYQAAITVS